MNGSLAKHIVWAGVIMVVTAKVCLTIMACTGVGEHVTVVAGTFVLVSGPITAAMGVLVHILARKEGKSDAPESHDARPGRVPPGGAHV